MSGRRNDRVNVASSRLLAEKGGGEPVLRRGHRLDLVAEGRRDPTDAESLTDSVVRSALRSLSAPHGRRSGCRPPAPLTALFDDSLVGVVEPHSQSPGEMAGAGGRGAASEDHSGADGASGRAPAAESSDGVGNVAPGRGPGERLASATRFGRALTRTVRKLRP